MRGRVAGEYEEGRRGSGAYLSHCEAEELRCANTRYDLVTNELTLLCEDISKTSCTAQQASVELSLSLSTLRLHVIKERKSK